MSDKVYMTCYYQVSVPFALVCTYVSSFLAWFLVFFVLLLVVIMFSFVSISQVIG